MIFCSQPLHVDLLDLAYSILKSASAAFFAATAAASLFLPFFLLSGTTTPEPQLSTIIIT